MGKSYLIECTKCGYRAAVAGGGAEGRDVRVQTVFCRDCRVLADSVTALRVNQPGFGLGIANRLKSREYLRPPSFAAAVNRLPPDPGARRIWLRFKLECPANPTHRVEPWKQPGRCPRCRTLMEQNALPYRVWD